MSTGLNDAVSISVVSCFTREKHRRSFNDAIRVLNQLTRHNQTIILPSMDLRDRFELSGRLIGSSSVCYRLYANSVTGSTVLSLDIQRGAYTLDWSYNH